MFIELTMNDPSEALDLLSIQNQEARKKNENKRLNKVSFLN